MAKKVMFLGGNYVQQTAIIAAKKLGYEVISVDYLPENPGHKYSDYYYNISTIDKDKVLNLAQQLKIDGIISYASDVSAPTAAYVAEKLNIPTNPYNSVEILTHKHLFRKFMKENKFIVPEYQEFTDYQDAKKYINSFLPNKTLIIKPIDSSGSKGVSIIKNKEEFDYAFKEAMNYSITKKIIIEEYIEKVGYQIDGDIFVVDGKIAFLGFCDQYNDLSISKTTPLGSIYPPILNNELQQKAKKQIEKILELLNMKIGAYNIEFIVTKNDEILILEIAPRNGGNLITDIINESCNVNLAELTIKQSVGDLKEKIEQKKAKYHCCSYIIHSKKDGFLKEINFSDTINKYIIRKDIFVKKGEQVYQYKNAKFGIGMLILKFDTRDELNKIIKEIDLHINIITN